MNLKMPLLLLMSRRECLEWIDFETKAPWTPLSPEGLRISMVNLFNAQTLYYKNKGSSIRLGKAIRSRLHFSSLVICGPIWTHEQANSDHVVHNSSMIACRVKEKMLLDANLTGQPDTKTGVRLVL